MPNNFRLTSKFLDHTVHHPISFPQELSNVLLQPTMMAYHLLHSQPVQPSRPAKYCRCFTDFRLTWFAWLFMLLMVEKKNATEKVQSFFVTWGYIAHIPPAPQKKTPRSVVWIRHVVYSTQNCWGQSTPWSSSYFNTFLLSLFICVAVCQTTVI